MSTGELLVTSATSGSANCSHCCAVSPRFTLTLNSEFAGPLESPIVANSMPPGWTKFMGISLMDWFSLTLLGLNRVKVRG